MILLLLNKFFASKTQRQQTVNQGTSSDQRIRWFLKSIRQFFKPTISSSFFPFPSGVPWWWLCAIPWWWLRSSSTQKVWSTFYFYFVFIVKCIWIRGAKRTGAICELIDQTIDSAQHWSSSSWSWAARLLKRAEYQSFLVKLDCSSTVIEQYVFYIYYLFIGV